MVPQVRATNIRQSRLERLFSPNLQSTSPLTNFRRHCCSLRADCPSSLLTHLTKLQAMSNPWIPVLRKTDGSVEPVGFVATLDDFPAMAKPNVEPAHARKNGQRPEVAGKPIISELQLRPAVATPRQRMVKNGTVPKHVAIGPSTRPSPAGMETAQSAQNSASADHIPSEGILRLRGGGYEDDSSWEFRQGDDDSVDDDADLGTATASTVGGARPGGARADNIQTETVQSTETSAKQSPSRKRSASDTQWGVQSPAHKKERPIDDATGTSYDSVAEDKAEGPTEEIDLFELPDQFFEQKVLVSDDKADVIDLSTDEDLDDLLLLSSEAITHDQNQQSAGGLSLGQIPRRDVTTDVKDIPCNDGVRRSVTTMIDEGQRAELLSRLLVGLILTNLGSATIDDLNKIGGGVNKTHGPYFCIQFLSRAATPFLPLLADYVREKCGTRLFRITLVTDKETDQDQVFLKSMFPSVAELVSGYLTDNTTCEHEDKVKTFKLLMQAGQKGFEIGAGGRKYRQMLDSDRSKSVIRTTAMEPAVQATTHVGKKPENGQGCAATLQFTHRNSTPGDAQRILESVAHFVEAVFFGDLSSILVAIRAQMLDHDDTVEWGASYGRNLRKSVRAALATKSYVDIFTDGNVLRYCQTRMFWGKIHETMGHIFYRESFWTPAKDKALFKEVQKFVGATGRIDWDAFMKNEKLGFGKSTRAYQTRFSALWARFNSKTFQDWWWERRL
jgi:hypothetical protein